MKRLAIINPTSGNGSTAKKLPQILHALKGIADETVITQHPGHCREIAAQAISYSGLIAVGGDGTFCEVINGMNLSLQSLALIPSGTGNSLSRDLGLRNFEHSIEVCKHGTPQSMDLLCVTLKKADNTSEQWYSASTVALGYVVNCTRLADRGFKCLGKLCYPVVSTLCAIRRNKITMNLQYNKTPSCQRSLSCLLINNIRHSANFEVFPQACINDGRFEVMEMDAPFFKQMIHNISVLSGKHFYMPAKVSSTSALHVALNESQVLLIDGELIQSVTAFTIESVKQGLQCFSLR